MDATEQRLQECERKVEQLLRDLAELRKLATQLLQAQAQAGS
jgi:hypothetical protein